MRRKLVGLTPLLVALFGCGPKVVLVAFDAAEVPLLGVRVSLKDQAGAGPAFLAGFTERGAVGRYSVVPPEAADVVVVIERAIVEMGGTDDEGGRKATLTVDLRVLAATTGVSVEVLEAVVGDRFVGAEAALTDAEVREALLWSGGSAVAARYIPRRTEAHRTLYGGPGVGMALAGDWDRALVVFRERERLGGRAAARSLHNQAVSLEALGHLREALSRVDTALAVHPTGRTTRYRGMLEGALRTGRVLRHAGAGLAMDAEPQPAVAPVPPPEAEEEL